MTVKFCCKVLGVICFVCLVILKVVLFRLAVIAEHFKASTFINGEFLDRNAVEAKAAEKPSTPSTSVNDGFHDFARLQYEAKSSVEFTCRNINFKAANLPMILVNLRGGGSLYVHSEDDAVSKDIKNNGRNWEGYNINKQVAIALERHAKKLRLPKQDIILLDIGANVGACSLQMAALGYSVIAFEPLPSNCLLIKGTLCENPSIKERFTLFSVALGEKEAACVVFSADNNKGDGTLSCDPNLKLGPGYSSRITTKVELLDDYLDAPSVNQRIGAAKIDVGGFAPLILLGGMEVLIKSKIPVIFAKNPLYIRNNAGNPFQFIRLILDGGYVAAKSLAHYRAGMFSDKVHIVARYNDINYVFVYHPKKKENSS